MKSATVLAGLGLVAACATTPPAPVETAVPVAPSVAADTTGWRTIATNVDGERLDSLPALWARALDAARLRHRGTIVDEGPLLDPAAGLDHPGLSPGPYQCRLVRFGEPAGRDAPLFRRYRPFFCYVDGENGGPRLSFAKQTGSERPGGWLYPDGDRRYVFLGTDRGGLSGAVPGYGAQPTQDRVGVAERIGPFRWRLAMPGRGPQARLDILELVPVPPPVENPAALASR